MPQQEHYYTNPIKTTFNQMVEKRTMTGQTLETHKFPSKDQASDFLNEKNFYVNGKLVHTTSK